MRNWDWSQYRFDYQNTKKTRDLLPDEFLDNMESCVHARIGVGKRQQRERMRACFVDFMKLVIDDCMQNETVFLGPNMPRVRILICEKNIEYVIKRLKGGAYTDTNIIKSDGKFYEFRFHCSALNPRPWNPVMIGYKKYKELVQLVNSGKRYLEKATDKVPEDKIRKMAHFLPKMKELWPNIPERTVREIVRFAFLQIKENMARNNRILIRSGAKRFQLIMYEKKI